MDDTKKIFATFLLVLFVLIVIGVTISSVASKKGNMPIIGGGALERALFPDRAVKEPTPAGQAAAQKKSKAASNTVVIKKTTGNQGQTANLQITPMQKGGNVQNGSVPSQKNQTIVPNTQQNQPSGQNSGNTTAGNPSDSAVTTNEQKGGDVQSIPSTGASTLSLLFSLAGLGSGVYLKRKIG